MLSLYKVLRTDVFSLENVDENEAWTVADTVPFYLNLASFLSTEARKNLSTCTSDELHSSHLLLPIPAIELPNRHPPIQISLYYSCIVRGQALDAPRWLFLQLSGQLSSAHGGVEKPASDSTNRAEWGCNSYKVSVTVRKWLEMGGDQY